MKTLSKGLLIVAGVATSMVTPLAAQEHREVADVPFAFVVANRVMPAGHYSVAELSSGSATFTITDARHHSVIANFGSNTEGNPDRPSLTFACYSNECVLAKITPPDSSAAYSLSHDGIERQLKHKIGMAAMVNIRLTAH